MSDPGYGWGGCYAVILAAVLALLVLGWFAGTWLIGG